MSEEVKEIEQKTETVVTDVNPFATDAWEEKKVEEKSEEVKIEEAKPVVEEAKPEVIINTDFETQFEQKYGKKPSDYDAEIEALRTAQTAAEIKFANEQSKTLYELLREGKEDDVYAVLSEKKKLDRILNLDASVPTSAAEIVRLSLAQQHKELDADEVEYLFHERYGKPEKPVKGEYQEDAEYDAEVAKWQARCDAIDKKVVIDAKISKPNLEKMKSELVLPDISPKSQPADAAPTGEAAEKIQQLRDSYLAALSADYKNTEGYKTAYKDEEVELPIAFSIAPEEKEALKVELENFDIEAFISERWFTNGKPNVTRLMEDIYEMRNREKIHQKIANEAGAKRLAHHIKQSANINVTGTQKAFNPASNKQEADKMAEHFFSN